MTTYDDLVEWQKQLETKIETINDRTKIHTIYIRELRKRIDLLEKEEVRVH